MSLTSQLKDPHSNVSRFFAEHFPDHKRFEEEWAKRIWGVQTISPHGALWKYPWALVETRRRSD